MEVLERIGKELFRSKATRIQFIKFAMAGAFCATVEFIVLILLVEQFKFALYYANTLAFSLAVLINYILSRTLVFVRGRHTVVMEFLFFVLVNAVGLAFNYLILRFCVEQLGLDYRIGKIIAIGIVVCWNFVAKKFFVFKG